MRNKRIKVLVIIMLMAISIMGCDNAKDYSGEYNFETDDQYSYATSIVSWKKYQSDGNGQYILMNDYIYYYNNETKQMNPLCSKANCLHDMENDKERRGDCNAYLNRGGDTDGASVDVEDSGYKYIQYYEGNVYYFMGSSLYSVSKDGSSKKKIYTVGDGKQIGSWLLHRGKLYYELEEYTYEGENVYSKGIISMINLEKSMDEKNSKVIFETEDELNLKSLGNIQAYKNKLFFSVSCNSKDFTMTDNESWIESLESNYYMYDVDSNQLSVIDVPDKKSNTDIIGTIVFLKDKLLIKKYDDMQDLQYETPIYAMNYDTKDISVWMDGIPQDSGIMTYDDYVIIDDADIQFFNNDNTDSCNVKIYSSDAKQVSGFEYELNSIGTFAGFGPDGISVDVTQNDTSWSVCEIKFDDVKKCNGDKITPKIVNVRDFGELNNIVW